MKEFDKPYFQKYGQRGNSSYQDSFKEYCFPKSVLTKVFDLFGHPQSILDVGSATGHYAKWVAKTFEVDLENVHCIENSSWAVSKAVLPTIKADATNLHPSAFPRADFVILNIPYLNFLDYIKVLSNLKSSQNNTTIIGTVFRRRPTYLSSFIKNEFRSTGEFGMFLEQSSKWPVLALRQYDFIRSLNSLGLKVMYQDDQFLFIKPDETSMYDTSTLSVLLDWKMDRNGVFYIEINGNTVNAILHHTGKWVVKNAPLDSYGRIAYSLRNGLMGPPLKVEFEPQKEYLWNYGVAAKLKKGLWHYSSQDYDW